MKKILLVFAHPLPRKSRINRALLKAVRDMEGVTFHDLYEVYPDFHIQVKKEQDLLLKHDVIVFQHPFYWYSTPAIIKQWEDLVLEHGFAYGAEGTALKGKLWLQVISSGGAAEAYRAEGYNRFTIRQLLAPLEQTAYLCQMPYLPPFAVQGTFQLTEQEISAHASRYRKLLEALRDETVDLEALRPHQLMPLELPMTND
jgi:glutathione-regulated potassium-efflux system ancillary protein KefG